jgi:hypothetical protein
MDIQQPDHPLLQSPGALRQLSGLDTAAACMEMMLQMVEAEDAVAALTEADCLALISACFDRGNYTLASVRLGLHMSSAKLGSLSCFSFVALIRFCVSRHSRRSC